MARNGATIRDVAKQAGVSVGTASKAFNQTGTLTEETRRRVLMAAASLHYTPNALIRSLQRGNTQIVGVLAWSIPTEVAGDIWLVLLKGIAAGLTEAGFDTLLYSHLPERHLPLSPATFLDGRVDGAIISPCSLTENGMQELAAYKFPAVMLYERDVPDGLGSVNIDNAAGITKAVDHLVSLGHRRIACYAPSLTHDHVERRDAYVRSLKRHGLPCDPALIPPVALYHEPIDAVCEQLLALRPSPTALIAADDHHAFRWIGEFARHGMRVPDDISVVGFDDVPAAGLAPGLTTIRQPAEQVGLEAARFVHMLIQGCPAEECRIVLPVDLIVRGTTAPPRTSS